MRKVAIDWKRALPQKEELYAKAVAGEIPFDVADVYERLHRQSGQFFTPKCVAVLMALILRSHGKRVYDPSCGPGRLLAHCCGSFVFGQELDEELVRLARMAIPKDRVRIICGDTLAGGGYCTKFDVVMANPPFECGTDAWVAHCLERVTDDGVVGIILPNSAKPPEQFVECEIRLPNKLFFSTSIAVKLWVLRKEPGRKFSIDASHLGTMVDRAHRDLTDGDIGKIFDAYLDGEDLPKSKVEDDGEPFDEKMKRLVAQLEEQFTEGARLEAEIRKNLRGLGYG